MASLKLITILLALVVLSFSSPLAAPANPVFRRQPKKDQARLSKHPAVPGLKKGHQQPEPHAPGEGINCGYVEKATRDFPCGKVPSAAEAKRYRLREMAAPDREECARACFGDSCFSFSFLEGRCALFSEEAFFVKDVMTDVEGPLYDVRCFNCS